MKETTDKSLEEVIKHQKAEIFRLKNVIENLPCIVYWKDKNGLYLGRNNFSLETINSFQYTNDWADNAVIGKTDYDFFSKEDADLYRKHDLEVMKTQRELCLEEPVILKNGQNGVLLSTKRPIYNEEGEVVGIVGNTVNITHLKEIETELTQAKARAEQSNIINSQLLEQTKDALRLAEEHTIGTNRDLANFAKLVTGQSISNEKLPLEYTKNIYNYMENIVASMPLSVYWMNKQGVYLGCNDNFAKLFNLKNRHDILGKSYNDLYGEESGHFYKSVDLEVMNTGIAKTLEEPWDDHNGSKTIWLSSKVPLRDSVGMVIGMVGISLDITNRKKNEQELKEEKERAEAASLAKSEFLAVVSHELRIPLTGILGMTQLLQTKNLTPNKQQEYLHHILAAGMHLLNLINDILDFAKLEAAQMQLSSAPLDLKALIEETSTMLTPLAKAKKLELLIQFENMVPHNIFGDKRLLRQIIINLLGNAIKFTEQGYVSIQIDCIAQTTNFATLVISVSDTGIGIPEEKQGMIFDLFSQVDSSHSRRYDGTGLGLTITKQLIELMSGTISVTSQVGKGTTFRCVIEFPLQKEAIMSAPWMSYESNVRVLIIDDTPRGSVLQKQISTSNSQVVAGEQAFNTLLASCQTSDAYAVVICDQSLETTDPFVLAKLIKEYKFIQQPMLILLTDDATAKKY